MFAACGGRCWANEERHAGKDQANMLLILQPSHLIPNNTSLQNFSPPAAGDVGQPKSNMWEVSSQHASSIITEPSESQEHLASKNVASCGGRCWANEERYAGKETPFFFFQGGAFYFCFGFWRGAEIKGGHLGYPTFHFEILQLQK